MKSAWIVQQLTFDDVRSQEDKYATTIMEYKPARFYNYLL